MFLNNNQTIILALVAVFIAPLIGGILMGLDRKLSARLQGRLGPPLLQPFYDVFKLMSKKPISGTKIQIICIFVYLVSVILSLVLLMAGQDMLVMILVLAMGSIFFILGGFSVKSPYSNIGSQREILQVLAYEPLIIFYVVAIYLKTGSFMASKVFALKEPLLYSMPLFVAALIIIMVIKLRKSPFDLSTSHHAHQELVKGITTELSGRHLAIIELVHWYEMALLMWLAMLLFASNLWIGFAIGLFCLFAVIVIDNITARLTWSDMLRFAWKIGVPIAVVNLAYIYYQNFTK
jgi:formate hydrogenlyase subunit 4